MPEAYVLETLRTARTKASPRGGFAGISPVDLLIMLTAGQTTVEKVMARAILLGCVVDERVAS